MSGTLNSSEKPKRAPRKRVVAGNSKVATKSPRRAPARKVSVKKASTKETKPALVEKEDSPLINQSARKAPTSIASQEAASRFKRKQILTVSAFILIGIGLSAAVGFTDRGQIDVIQTIEDRNQRIKDNQADDRDVVITSVAVPVQNTKNNQADGGLRGLSPEEVALEEAKVAPPTDTATSTDSLATSTEAVAPSTDSLGEDASTISIDENTSIEESGVEEVVDEVQ